MSQPPHSSRPPNWRRPRGVSVGTWEYVNQRTIATHYDAFVGATPLCNLDRQFIQAHLPPVDSEPQVVLDLGCGTGRLAIPLAARGFQVIGIDLSRSMLEQMLAKSRLERGDGQPPQADGERSGRPGNLSAVQANLVDLDCLQSKSADHAICMFSTLGMIQGHANRLAMLRHVHRCIRPGGVLLIHVHRRWAALRESRGWSRLGKSWIRSVVSSETEFGDSTYPYRGLSEMFLHRFSRRELKSLLMEAGWNLEVIDAVDLRGEKLTRSRWNASGYLVMARRVGVAEPSS